MNCCPMKRYGRWFLVQLCIFLLATKVVYNSGALLLETPKEAWILSGTKISVNCSLIFNDSKKVKIHWEKNGTMVNHISNKFLQEVSLNDKGVQLQFINAKEADAGIYKCVAEEENGKRCNATSNIHIGNLPSYGGYTCSFDPNNNLIWISPIIKNAKENLYLQIKFCMSNYKNLYCRRDGSWQNTTCIQSEMSCSMRLKKNSKYVLQLLLSNGYGTTFNQSVLAFPERHCVDTPPEIKQILVIDQKRFLVSWKLPPHSHFATISIFENSTDQMIFETTVSDNEATKTIGENLNLRQCTWYKIRIEVIRGKSTICSHIKTVNKNIPEMKNLKMSENILKNTLEFYWTDPTASSDTRPRVFFYNYKIIGSNLTIQDNVNSTKMFVTRPEVSEIFFDVKLCTDCGCGESISKIFQLKRKPPLPGSNQGIKVKSKIPLIVGSTTVAVVLILILIFFILWRLRKSNQQPPEIDDQTYTEFVSPENLVPLRPTIFHEYMEVDEREKCFVEVEHYDQQTGRNDSIGL